MIISIISTTSSIMFMLSCTIVIKFSQGDYDTENWNTYSTTKKAFNFFLLSIVGYAIMVVMFLIQITRKIFLPLSLIGGPGAYFKLESAIISV